MVQQLYPVRPVVSVAPEKRSTSSLEIRPIANVEELEKVYQLTHDNYVAKGYAAAQENGLLLHYPEFDVLPETTILVAIQDGEVIGSISYTQAGLYGVPIDNEFGKERQAMEKDGRGVVDVWRLVVKESCRTSRKVVFGLFAETLRRTLQKNVSTWLLTVNPQHEGLYKRLFNARIIARKETTLGLSNAPAVFLSFDQETLPAEWKVADPAIQSSMPLGSVVIQSLFDKFSDSSALNVFTGDY